MTKWQLPQGVEYPIEVRVVRASPYGTTSIKDTVSSDHDLSLFLISIRYQFAHSIRINNSIDLVKVEE